MMSATVKRCGSPSTTLDGPAATVSEVSWILSTKADRVAEAGVSALLCGCSMGLSARFVLACRVGRGVQGVFESSTSCYTNDLARF